MNCYKCDTLLEKDWNYCPNCKRRIKKSKLNEEELISTDEAGKCHKCSFDLDDNWNFCPVCGTAVEFISDKPKVSVPIIAAANDEPNKGLDPRETEENELLSDTILCPNCGVKVLENQPFCAQCGHALNDISASVLEESTRSGYVVYLLMGYLLPFCGITLLFIHEFFMYACNFFSVFSMVYALSTYPKSKVVKIAFVLYLVFALVVIGGTIWFYLTCKSIGCGEGVWG